MIDIIMAMVVIIIYILMGARSIDVAIISFKKEDYGKFGLNLIIAIMFISLILILEAKTTFNLLGW